MHHLVSKRKQRTTVGFGSLVSPHNFVPLFLQNPEQYIVIGESMLMGSSVKRSGKNWLPVLSDSRSFSCGVRNWGYCWFPLSLLDATELRLRGEIPVFTAKIFVGKVLDKRMFCLEATPSYFRSVCGREWTWSGRCIIRRLWNTYQ